MIIYHGSYRVIKNPKAGGSNPENDFGPSFYTTLDLELAKLWACKNNKVGLVSKYYLRNSDYKNLKILDLTDESKYSVLNWLAILMHFRKLTTLFKTTNQYYLEWLEEYYIDVAQYDIVIGYRADDRYFRFPSYFLEGLISLEQLKNVFHLGKLGKQHAFMSEKAIKCLKFENYIDCGEEYIASYETLVNNANKIIDNILSKPRDPKQTYIMDIYRSNHE